MSRTSGHHRPPSPAARVRAASLAARIAGADRLVAETAELRRSRRPRVTFQAKAETGSPALPPDKVLISQQELALLTAEADLGRQAVVDNRRRIIDEAVHDGRIAAIAAPDWAAALDRDEAGTRASLAGLPAGGAWDPQTGSEQAGPTALTPLSHQELAAVFLHEDN